ncbi:hypothetical protein IWQ60_008271 [Tieghemiomyces parasiticus]|uniref:Uncharacterized protein n=1 Tax=Tieghemiomyces parasiticus TaxID=78921 RepID=A0A9W7ZSY2_9FUNG|nr:hypothetical protein IWQ60_008271 [Tieghemiomyces parasiticus]
MYGAYLQFFDEEIRQHGLDAAFRTYYPSLLAGMFGGLFHPLIHLGYALEFRNELLLGEGFAYACSWYRDLGAIIDETSPQDIPRAATDPWQALQVIAADMSGDFTADAAEPEFETRLCGVLARPRMVEKMTQLVQGYVPLDPAPPVSGYSGDHNNSTFDDEKGPNTSDESDEGLVTLDVLHRLTECTVAVYADLTSKGAHLDFYLAHAVTSLIATFMILPYLDDSRDRVRQLRLQLFALLGVYTVEGRGDLPRQPTAAVSIKLKREASEAETAMATATPDDSLSGTDRWMDIRSRAILANDDHVAKVVRALDFFRMLYGDPDDQFYRAALRTVDEITVADDWRFHALPSNASKS